MFFTNWLITTSISLHQMILSRIFIHIERKYKKFLRMEIVCLVNGHFSINKVLWCRHKSTTFWMRICWTTPKLRGSRLRYFHFNYSLPLTPSIVNRWKQRWIPRNLFINATTRYTRALEPSKAQGCAFTVMPWCNDWKATPWVSNVQQLALISNTYAVQTSHDSGGAFPACDVKPKSWDLSSSSPHSSASMECLQAIENYYKQIFTVRYLIVLKFKERAVVWVFQKRQTQY